MGFTKLPSKPGKGVVRSSSAATKRVHQTRAHGGVMNRTIEIIIGTTGDIQIDAVGFKGPDCEKATQFLEEALGMDKESVHAHPSIRGQARASPGRCREVPRIRAP